MRLKVFDVAPSIPKELSFLETLSTNMWWSWQPEAIALFRRINSKLWRSCDHNPVEFMSKLHQSKFEALAHDESFKIHMKRIEKMFNKDITDKPGIEEGDSLTAYFSLEYGIHESLKIYSGGLGVLSGDHLKASSDIGMPLVAIGLLYRQGYFQQYLNDDGWQQERYPENEMHFLPYQRVYLKDTTEPLTISVPLPEGELKASVWKLNVGRTPLFLLDANIPENPAEFRGVTAQLYGGDRKNRLRQEILLGVGGFQTLIAMGLNIKASHINEGHAAFMSLARISHLKKTQNIDLDTAREIVTRTNVFTTHTPVPAGNETFSLDMIKPHLQQLEKTLDIPADTVISWGQAPDASHDSELSMTILGLRLARHSNGVSKLHGAVARKMWNHLWPSHAVDEVPIDHVTNGIHVSSFLSQDLAVLFDRYLGSDWRCEPDSEKVANYIDEISDEELWRAHELGRSRLIRNARERMEKQCAARNASRLEIQQAKSILDHDALTIGFARRFATYKRATLLLRDKKRLKAILSNTERPVQFVFAGKAHPADDHGKDLIRQLVHFAKECGKTSSFVFIENYDLNLGRLLVQGVDVWMNVPKRPMEASGTSGMKAAVNGALNLSILDGWWCEGYSPACGWAIGTGEEYEDLEYQDAVEAHALYNLIENDVIETYYDRQTGDLPAKWIQMMRGAMKMSLGFFSSNRMVKEYYSKYYEPSMKMYDSLVAENGRPASELVKHNARLKEKWNQIGINNFSFDKADSGLHVGDNLTVKAEIHLGEITPDEVDVQLYFGPIDSKNRIIGSHCETLPDAVKTDDGNYVYTHTVGCTHTGRYGFTIRIKPSNDTWKHVIPGYITWADGGH